MEMRCTAWIRGRRADSRGETLLFVDRNSDRSPFALIESDYAERAPSHMTDENRDPDVNWLECRQLFYHEANTQRNYNLRDDGDVQRALCVSCPLKTARVCQ